MTETDRMNIIKALKSMMCTLGLDVEISSKLKTKTTFELIKMFLKYKALIKEKKLKRPAGSYISQVTYEKMILLISKNHTDTSVNRTYDQEDLEILNYLESLTLADLDGKEQSKMFPYLNSSKLRSLSSSELLDVFGLCTYFQLSRLESIIKTNQNLGIIDDSKMKLDRLCELIRRVFGQANDYFALLSNFEEITTWSTAPIIECRNTLDGKLKTYLYQSPEKQKYLNRIYNEES